MEQEDKTVQGKGLPQISPGEWSLHPASDGTPLAVDMEGEGQSFVAWTYTVGSGTKMVAECTAYSHGDTPGYGRPTTRAEAKANAIAVAALPHLLSVLQEIAQGDTMKGRETWSLQDVVEHHTRIAQKAIDKSAGRHGDDS